MACLDTIGGIHYEMMRRCYNDKSVAYKDYGAKGIVVCDEWKDRENFRKWCLENGWEKNLRLNRKDSSLGYYPDNCYFGNISTKRIDSVSQTRKEKKIIKNKKKQESKIVGLVSDDKLYSTYTSMHTRCENSKHINYKHYGGRGIFVCDAWSGKDGFYNFKKWALENGWINGLTIDRIDNDKGYEPSNCIWVTKNQQLYNRRNNIKYNYCGIEMPLGMIAKLEQIDYSMLYSRVRKKGMSVNEALIDIRKGVKK